MKLKHNMPSKAQILNFNEFIKCFINWFKSQSEIKQRDFCKQIGFDPLVLDDIVSFRL